MLIYSKPPSLPHRQLVRPGSCSVAQSGEGPCSQHPECQLGKGRPSVFLYQGDPSVWLAAVFVLRTSLEAVSLTWSLRMICLLGLHNGRQVPACLSTLGGGPAAAEHGRTSLTSPHCALSSSIHPAPQQGSGEAQTIQCMQDAGQPDCESWSLAQKTCVEARS